MKKNVLVLIGMLLLNSVMFSQVMFDFENGVGSWENTTDKGSGITNFTTIADPTSRATGYVADLTFNSSVDTAGQISICCSVDFKSAPAIGFWVYLPTGIPDSYYLKVVAQDGWCWCDAPNQYSVANIPKDTWYPIYLFTKALDLAKGKNIFAGGLAKLQLRIGNGVADEAWAGDIYLDNIEALGSVPETITDFESGAGGWGKGHFGTAINADSVKVIADPTSRATGNVFAATYNGSLDPNKGGSIAKEPYSHFNPDLFALWVYLPADIPSGFILKLVGQDDNSWSDAATSYNVSDIPKEKWFPITLNSKALDIAQSNFDLENHNLAKFLLEVLPGTATGDELNWTGTFYVDDFAMWSKAVPASYIVSDFETVAEGLDGWYNDAGLGAAIDSLVRVSFDDGNRLAGYFNFASETKGNITKDNVVVYDTATATAATDISVDIYLPSDIPDGKVSLLVGSDYTTASSNISDIGRGKWSTVYFGKMGQITDPTKNVGITIRVELNSAASYTCPVYFDNITVWGINEPVESIVSPQAIGSIGTGTTVRNVVHDYAVIDWVDNSNSSVQYRVYKSESPITNTSDEGVQRVASEIAQGVQQFCYQPYTSDGSPVTLYFAVVAVAFDATGAGTETPLNDQCKVGPLTIERTLRTYKAVYVKDFASTWSLDYDQGDSTAFLPYKKYEILPTGVWNGRTDGSTWDTTSVDCNFRGFVVVDDEYFYIHFDMWDDDLDPATTAAYNGDAVEFYMGFYDSKTEKDLHSISDWNIASKATYSGDWRLGVDAVGLLNIGGGESTKGGLDVGYSPSLSNDGYSYTLRIAIDSVTATGKENFLKEGIVMPLRIDANDHDPNKGETSKILVATGGKEFPTLPSDWTRPETWGNCLELINYNPVGVNETTDLLPKQYKLYANYPNPFNPSTRIKYDLPKESVVQLKIYDVVGREVTTLVNETQKAGTYQVNFNAASLTSGVYFCRITAGDFTHSQKMIMLK